MGRGAQVVEKDLAEALRAVPSRVAVLDVTWPEPPEPDNCLPHIAGSIGNEVHRMAEYMFEEYKDFDAGLKTQFSVTKKMLEAMA